MIYRIVNMSDAYTIEADKTDVAFVACLVLGHGTYAFEPVGEGEKIPLFMFGGLDEFSQKHFGKSVEAMVNEISIQRREELAACFDSCLIGTPDDRQAYRDGLALIDDPAKKKEWRDRWHDQRRSSLNDIGGRAYEMAANLRRGDQRPLVQAPSQIFTSEHGSHT